MDHLNTLMLRLSNERMRLLNATNDTERKYRAQVVAGVEREIAGERAFLGLAPEVDIEMSDDDLLGELS